MDEVKKILNRVDELAKRHQTILEENILLNNKLREEEQDRITEFSCFSHELKKPLTVIAALIDRFPQKTKKQRQNVSEIQTEIIRATHLIDKILIFNQLQIFDFEEKEEINLSQLFEKIFGFYKMRDLKNLKWFADLEPEIYLKVNRNQIFLILENLLENAVKYNHNKGEIILKLKKVGEKLVFSVEDTGIGISQVEQKRISQPFFRSKNNRNEKGTGLGLSIVCEAVKKLNGELKIQSEIHKGSTFTVII